MVGVVPMHGARTLMMGLHGVRLYVASMFVHTDRLQKRRHWCIGNARRMVHGLVPTPRYLPPRYLPF